jgi:ankyrin repeat protein
LMLAINGLDKNADVDEKTTATKLLLDAGADVHVRNKIGMTPLMLAAESSGGLLFVKWLRARGADVRVKDNRGMTALQYAAGVRNAAVVKLLRMHDGR